MNTFHETSVPLANTEIGWFKNSLARITNFRVKGCVECMSGPMATRIRKRGRNAFLDAQSEIGDIRVQQIRTFQFAHIETKLGYHDS